MLLNFEHLKTFYSALKQKMKNFRGDWNQNDPTANDYIKNRPFYEGSSFVEIVSNLTAEDYNNGNRPECNFVIGDKYKVIWNGTTYDSLVCYDYDGYNAIGGNGYPFYIDDDGGNNLYIEHREDNDNFVVSIYLNGTVVHKLDKKFIDIPDNLVTTEILEEVGIRPYSEGLAYVLVGDEYEVSGIGTCTDLDIVIPFSVDGKRVVSIGRDAFRDCSNLTSITIPDSVTSIGKYAFSNCSGLTNVIIPGSVTIIDTSAFSVCSGLTNITISDGVMNIGENAFAGCDSLTSVIIPDSVTSIGYSAFQGCDSLINVVIGDGVTDIYNYAFNLCPALISITIPSSVTDMGSKVFNGCNNLTIYCEAESAHKFWNSDWNSGNRPVIWGAALDLPSVNDKLNDCKAMINEAIGNAIGGSY